MGNPARNWHELTADEATEFLGTDARQGLAHPEVEERRARHGANRLTARRGRSPLILFLLQFHQPLVYILIAAGVTTGFLGEWVDSGVIFGVVLVNAVIGYMQESKALRAIAALSGSVTSEATVVRGGEKRRIDAVDLVPGDIVFLQSGDKVPADLRLVHTRELQVEEAPLTGESVPVQKHADPLPADTVLADRTNLAHSSTLVTYGTARGAVIATGDRTEIGRIHELLATADDLETPLTRRITSFSRVLLYVILGLAGVTFAVGLLQGRDWDDMLIASVALAVGAIPEGLPAAVTITLAIGVNKMARRHAIIRRLPAVETLGSTTVICSDKTGTLTQNQMTVQEIVVAGSRWTVTGGGYDPQGEFTNDGEPADPQSHAAVQETLRAGLLCNDARVFPEEGTWRVEGDPTEGALIVAARKAGLEPEQAAAERRRVESIPFESQHQYMATLHETGDAGQRVAYVKGSVERILARCETALDADGGTESLEAGVFHEAAAEIGSRGLRVLAFARREFPPDTDAISHQDIESGLTFLGLQAMIDPPREEAISAVRVCRDAGVQVKMITGDHPGTAVAIAEAVGLEGARDGEGRLAALTGRDIAELDDAALIEAVDHTAVFARVAPEQKLRLVKALQSRGHVAAMTGDGVNDAPALRQADIGIAMGVTGTEVAREAADMVLADDNFSSIEAAVEEGRGVYDNLIKFIIWTLPTNVGEGLVILVAILAGLRLPILPVQILWINMTTAVLLGLMLAFEPKEPGLMDRPPRDPRGPILTRPLVIRILLAGLLLLIGSFGLFEWELYQGKPIAVARTAAVNVFVVGGIFYLFNCRSLRYSMFRLGVFTNTWVLGGVALMVLLQLAFTYVPFMNTAFSSAPLDGAEWAAIVAIGLVIYAAIGAEKLIQQRRGVI